MSLTFLFPQSDAAIPLIPPPPAPLNIPPSRASRQLAARLALHKQQAEEATTSAQEAAARHSDDPFASLSNRDNEKEASDPFSLDEEEEDITLSGRRNKKAQSPPEVRQGFSVGRGLTSLFSSSSRGSSDAAGDEDEEMRGTPSPLEGDEGDRHSSDSEDGEHHHPLEATTTQERIPLETDEDDDEEMGEMVAPLEEADEDIDDEGHSNSSDDQQQGEFLSPVEREKLRRSFGSSGSADAPRPVNLGRRDRQQEHDEDDEDEEEGEGLVEIAMPTDGGRRTT